MSTIAAIKSRDWQISFAGVGSVAEGLNDVAQCIDIILRTEKGTDPLRPQFGSGIYAYVDKPVNVSIPNIKREIIEALGIWEKRIVLVRITHMIVEFSLYFFITYKLVDEDITDTLQLYLNNGGFVIGDQPQDSFILNGYFPLGFASLHLKPILTINGATVFPIPPKYGFATPAEMYSWVVTNYSQFGRWYLQADRLVVFLTPGIAISASLTITGSAVTRIEAQLPDKAPGEHFTFIFNGNTVSTTFTNAGAILAYAIANHGDLGDWSLISNSVDGDFAGGDFDPADFLGTHPVYKLVLYTFSTDTITFSIT